MLVDVALDGCLQVDDGMKDAAFQALSGQGREEVFDGIEPGTRCRREMEDPTGMSLEPGHDLGMFMRAIVVEDDMDHLACRHLTFDGVEEADELLMPVLLHTPADHRAVENVESSEQRGGAVAFVIVGHRLAFAGLERQAWLGAVECLDLGLFVNRQDDGMSGRRHVKANDVFKLGDKVGIVRTLERSETMRLQLMSLPDPLHRAQRHTHHLGHGPTGPMGDFTWRFAAGQGDQPLNIGVRHRRLAGLSAAFAEKTVDARLGKSALPAPDRRPADARKPGDLGDVQPSGRMQNDPSAGDMFLSSVTIGNDRFQANTIIGHNNRTDSLRHDHLMPCADANVNPMNVSVH